MYLKSTKWWRNGYYSYLMATVSHSWSIYQQLIYQKVVCSHIVYDQQSRLFRKGKKKFSSKIPQQKYASGTKCEKTMHNKGVDLPIETNSRKTPFPCNNNQTETMTKTNCVVYDIPLWKCFCVFFVKQCFLPFHW